MNFKHATKYFLTQVEENKKQPQNLLTPVLYTKKPMSIGEAASIVPVTLDKIRPKLVGPFPPALCIEPSDVYSCQHEYQLIEGHNKVKISSTSIQNMFRVEDVSTFCNYCTKKVGCLHVFLYQFLYNGIEIPEEYRTMIVDSIIETDQGDSMCRICKDRIYLSNKSSDPQEIIRGIESAAEIRGLTVSFDAATTIGRLLLQMIDPNVFGITINLITAPVALVSLAVSLFPPLISRPSQNDKPLNITLWIIADMIAVLALYHHTQLAAKLPGLYPYSTQTLEETIEEILNSLDKVAYANISAIQRPEICSRIDEDIQILTQMHQQYMVIMQNFIATLSLSTTAIKLHTFPVQSPVALTRKLMRVSTRSVYVPKASPRYINYKVALGDDGHLHEFVGNICKICNETLNVSTTDNTIDITDLKTAAALQEFNFHYCKAGRRHHLKDNKCILCNRNPNINRLDILHDKSLLSRFKHIIEHVPVVVLMDINSDNKTKKVSPVNIPNKPIDGFLQHIIPRIWTSEFLDVDGTNRYACLLAALKITNAIGIILMQADKLNGELLEQLINTRNILENCIIGYILEERSGDDALGYVGLFLEMVSVNTKLSEGIIKQITALLQSKIEYADVNYDQIGIYASNVIDAIQESTTIDSLSMITSDEIEISPQQDVPETLHEDNESELVLSDVDSE